MSDYFVAIKAVGDWELDILPIPFGSLDSDQQWFDDRTDIKNSKFQTPLIMYQHGIKKGGEGIQETPVEIGDAISGTWRKEVDGWHIRATVKRTLDIAKDIMLSAKNKTLAVSSGSIAHLARLDIGGKLIQYEKNRPGRIAVWPVGEISLWDTSDGNYAPANKYAVAMPVMKAMYKSAGLAFPKLDTGGVVDAEEVKRRARIEKVKQESIKNLNRLEKIKEY